MNRTRRRRLLPVTTAALAVLALAAAACGDDDDTSGDATIDAGTSPEAAASTPTAGATAGTTPDVTTEDGGTDDGGTADEAAYVAAVAEGLEIGDEEVSQCLAQELITGIGMDRIAASGLSPQELVDASSLSEVGLSLDPEAVPELTAAMAGCGDLVTAFLDSAGVTEAEAECVRPNFTSELIAEIIVTQLAELPASPEMDAAEAATEECQAG